MVQVINRPPSFGQLFGTGLGEGLSSGLQQLAQQKLQQVQQRNLSSNLEQLGVPQQQAQGISQLPAELQQLYLKDLLAAPGQQAYAQALGLGQQQSIPGEQQQSTAEQGQQQQPMAAPRLTEKQATEIAKLRQRQELLGVKEAKEAREYLAPQEKRKEILDQNIRNAKNIIDLVRSGETFTGPKRAVLDTLGLGSYFQRSVPQQLLEKTLAEQAQGAGAAFNTSRLTNLDVKLYQQSLGTVWNTDQGLVALSKNKILESKAEESKIKARREIIKENKGKIPYDIEELAEKKAEPDLKKYAEKAKKNIQDAISKKIKVTHDKSKSFNELSDIPTQGLTFGSQVQDTDTGAILTWNGSQWLP